MRESFDAGTVNELSFVNRLPFSSIWVVSCSDRLNVLLGRMQLPLQMDELTGPASPSSPGSDPSTKGSPGTTSSTPPREKPVKVLPCPRCESLNTKFCYYNNYSVTQPRHFCRQCQRYWTAGGTLRNVPVGGGSRKKNRHHPRGAGEPYSQRSPSGAGGSSSPFGLPGDHQSFGHQNGPGLHSLQQEMASLNFAQLPGFGSPSHYAPFGLDQLSQLSAGVYTSLMKNQAEATTDAMFGSNNTGAPQPMLSMSPGHGYYLQESPPTPPSLPFQTDDTAAVKPEFWPTAMAAPQDLPQGNYQVNKQLNGRFDSNSSPMLLNLGPRLGLNYNRPPPQPIVWDQSPSHHVDVKPAASTSAKNGSSPLHGSSLEEEGSTPSNGFSKSGYEEGDAVSSMWHSLHDMDNLQHLSVKW